jgi:hypothetical protein
MKRPLLLLALCSLLSATLAVTYRVDPANGPETLAAEVKEAFDAWVALSEKIEVEETEENPEGIFQYGATERFGPDTLSLTVQRRADTRSLIYLISPNAENRRRILLHETGIALGLTPQIPGTPLPTAPTPTPTEETPTQEDGETLEPETTESGDTSTEAQPSEEGTTEEQSTEEQTTNEQSTTAQTEESATTEEQTTEEGQATEEQATEEQTTQEQTTEEQSTNEETSESAETTDTTNAEPATESTETTSTDSTETDTLEAALTPNSVMNPSIGSDDSTELGDFERQLIENLELFVSQDINRDGVVNFYDLVALSQAFGRRDVNDPADINRDGVIDQGDVDELQGVYTFSDPSETAPGSSPSTEETPDETTDGTTPAEETSPPEETLPEGTLPEDLPPPQEDGTVPDEGSGE